MGNLVIEIPTGYVVDYENSTDAKIVFKKKQKSTKPFRSNDLASIKGYYINSNSEILGMGFVAGTSATNKPTNWNVFATKAQAKSALAMAQISQIMENDPRFGGVVTDEEWSDIDMGKYVITRSMNRIYEYYSCRGYCFLAFHTDEQRELFMKENTDLIKQYLMIDDE